VPVVVLGHVFALACLLFSGPVKLLLQRNGGVARLLRRRRGSVAGKLPRVQESDDEESEDALDFSPARQHQSAMPTQHATGTAAFSNRSGAAAHSDNAKQCQPPSKPEAPVEKVRLEWQQISCYYEGAQGRVVVLQDVWGQAEPGEMQVRCAVLALGVARGRWPTCLMLSPQHAAHSVDASPCVPAVLSTSPSRAFLCAGAAGAVGRRKVDADGHPGAAQVYGQPERLPARQRPAGRQQLHPQDRLRCPGALLRSRWRLAPPRHTRQ
jgi:hypothetical protein